MVRLVSFLLKFHDILIDNFSQSGPICMKFGTHCPLNEHTCWIHRNQICLHGMNFEGFRISFSFETNNKFLLGVWRVCFNEPS